MNLKPTKMELDPYILGIYESVMKKYWPNPRSELYCRVCNYREFKTMKDFEEHKKTPNHIVRKLNFFFNIFFYVSNPLVSVLFKTLIIMESTV